MKKVEQFDLFDQPYRGKAPSVAGSDTSEEAAESMMPTLGKLQASVFSMIRDSGPVGMTCDEVEMASGLRHQTASARIRELYLRGYVVDSGRRRLTRSNRKAVVWKRAVVFAREEVFGG
jgi:hypothetical protein